MFSAMTGFFTTAGAPASSGRITYLTGTSPYNNLAPFAANESGSERIVYVGNGNWVVCANSGNTSRPGANISVLADGTISWQNAFNATNGPLIGGACTDGSGNIYGFGLQTVSATTSVNYLKLDSTGTTLTTSSTGATTVPKPGQTSIDTTNSRIMYVSNSDNSTGSTTLRVYQSASLTATVPTLYRQFSSASGTFPTVNFNVVTNGRLCIVGTKLSGGINNGFIMITSALPLSGTSTISCFTLANTGTVNTVATHVCPGLVANNEVYVIGRTYSSVGATYTTYIAKYQTSGGGLAWAKILSTTAGVIKRGSVVHWDSTTGNLYTLSTNTTDTITLCCLTNLSSVSPTISYARQLKITTSTGSIVPVALDSDGTNLYIAAQFFLGAGTTSYPASFQFPIDGSIPGSGSYTVGSFSFTYTTSSESFLADTMTSSSISITNGNGTTITPTAVGTSIATISNMTSTTGTL